MKQTLHPNEQNKKQTICLTAPKKKKPIHYQWTNNMPKLAVPESAVPKSDDGCHLVIYSYDENQSATLQSCNAMEDTTCTFKHHAKRLPTMTQLKQVHHHAVSIQGNAHFQSIFHTTKPVGLFSRGSVARSDDGKQISSVRWTHKG